MHKKVCLTGNRKKAIVEKIHGAKNEPNNSYSDAYQKHKVVCCYDDRFSKQVQMYRGENAVYKFIETMLEEAF